MLGKHLLVSKRHGGEGGISSLASREEKKLCKKYFEMEEEKGEGLVTVCHLHSKFRKKEKKLFLGNDKLWGGVLRLEFGELGRETNRGMGATQCGVPIA